jgi:hypothetical protein
MPVCLSIGDCWSVYSFCMNPYASFLGDRDPLGVIAETPGQLSSLLDTLGPKGAERSLAPGKWSARKILCHLADTELAFAFRLRQALAEPHHVIQPFDQDKWAAPYGALEARAAVDVFRSVRQWNIALIRTVPAGALSKPLTHPERGTMTFQTLIETMAGHDLNHLRQIEGIASQSATA